MPRLDAPADHRVNASPECLQVCAAVSGFAFQHPPILRLHQLTVDTYGAQHGGGNSTPIRLAYSLVGLHLALEHLLPGDQVRAAHQRMGKPDSTWPAFTPPENVGPVTVLAVAEQGVMAGSVSGHAAAVEVWAQHVWRSWTDQHAATADLARRLLPDMTRTSQ